MIYKKCEYCNKSFVVNKKYPQKRFCSNSCRGKWQYQHGNNLPPKQNGNIPWNKGLNKKTDKRIERMSKDRMGIKNWMWKDDTTQSWRDKHKRELRKWRERIFERDNYTCQKCGERGGQLHPHHIRHLSEYPEEALDIDNGITLCIRCHKKEHLVFGKN